MEDQFSSHRTESETGVTPVCAALIVVDMINEFCSDGGGMVLPDSGHVIAPQNTLIKAARLADIPVIFVVDSHRRNLRHDREYAKRNTHSIEDTWATEVIPELDRQVDDFIVRKARYSAFFQTDLDLLLKDMRINQTIICGVVTNICVRSTVHDAFFLGYDVIVPHDACAATSEREQLSSLFDIATHFGTVSTSGQIKRSIQNDAFLTNMVFDPE